MKKKIKIIVFASGSGTTFEYLANHSSIEAALLVTDQKSCKALKRAEKLGIPFRVVCPRDYSSSELWDEAVTKEVQQFSKDSLVKRGDFGERVFSGWIVLAGFIRLLGPVFLSSFKGRVINSHPALLPDFGGKGMFGIHVHRAVLKAGSKETGVSVHYVSEEYDQGRIIAQKKIKVLKEDTPESLEARVKELEKPFYAEVIQQLPD